MAKAKKGNPRKPSKRTPYPPTLTFTVNDERTTDDLFPPDSAAWATKYYSDKFIESAARKFKIESAQIAIFKRFLGLAGSLYLSSAHVPTAERQQIAVREKLAAVADAHCTLCELLDNLSILERDRLWCSTWEDPGRPPGLIGLADRTTPRPFPDEAPFLESMGAFGKRVHTRHADLQIVGDRGGRPVREDVRVFIVVTRDFWVKVLGRKFRFQAVDGVPISQVFNFCKHLLVPLDASVTDRELVTAIRRAVKSANPTCRFYPS